MQRSNVPQSLKTPEYAVVVVKVTQATQLDCSLDGLFLLSEPKGVHRHTGDLDNLESDSWQVTHGVAWTTESGNENLVIFVDEGHTTVFWNEASDSFIVLLELNSHALSHGRVGLLGLDGNLLNNDASGVRCALERLSPLRDLMSFVEIVVGPSTLKQFKRLSFIHTCWVFCDFSVYVLRWFLLAFHLPLLIDMSSLLINKY